MRFQEDGRPEMSGKEYRTMWFAMMVESELRHMMTDFCEERIALVPDYEARMQAVFDEVVKINGLLLDTMPTKNLQRMRKELPLMDHAVRLRPVGTPPAEWILLRDKDVNELLKVVIEDKCPLCEHAMCLDNEDTKKVQQCALRKALMQIQAPENLDTNQCPYSALTWCSHEEMREKQREEEA